MNEIKWILSPSDFAFLWEECKRCYYLKVARKLSRPSGPMPRIFTSIDGQMKARYRGKRTSEVMPFLPNGLVADMGDRVESRPLLIPGHSSPVVLRGKLDTIIQFDDASYAIIDFKTSEQKPENLAKYARQLHAYAWAVERPSTKGLSIGPVTTLGLVTFEPAEFRSSRDGKAWLEGSASWMGIERDDIAFGKFLNEVVNLLDQTELPPASPECAWCGFIKEARRAGL